jgi:hypothetical protein
MNMSKVFRYNQGINTDVFGSEQDGYCYHGLYVLDLYAYVSSPGQKNSISFAYNGTDIYDLTYEGIKGALGSTVCLGICSGNNYTFHINTCQPCSSVIPYCQKCSSSTVCSLCFEGGFVLSSNSSSCNCPSRYVLNVSAVTCVACPYDCLSCDINGNCLTCADFRILNLNSSRCLCMSSYFDNGTSLCI